MSPYSPARLGPPSRCGELRRWSLSRFTLSTSPSRFTLSRSPSRFTLSRSEGCWINLVWFDLGFPPSRCGETR
ncbi:hypothetical protein T484DRAFT_1978034 [Baffinella frigidus]|nr:hypothetical protein T484DRAFT_1978034 [Cryptophyta sp. CCMP2293]